MYRSNVQVDVHVLWFIWIDVQVKYTGQMFELVWVWMYEYKCTNICTCTCTIHVLYMWNLRADPCKIYEWMYK